MKMPFGKTCENLMPYMKNSAGGTMTNQFSVMKMVELLFTTKLRRKTMNEKAERINGWAAMIGVIAAMGSYAATGQLIPGVW